MSTTLKCSDSVSLSRLFLVTCTHVHFTSSYACKTERKGGRARVGRENEGGREKEGGEKSFI